MTYCHRQTERHFSGGGGKNLPWKCEFPIKIKNFPKLHGSHPIEYKLCIENFFTIQDFLVCCACPEKQSLPWHFSLYSIYFLPFRIFEQFYACHQKQSLPWTFSLHMEYSFPIQELWAARACPEKQIVHWINCIFLSFRIFEQVELSMKKEFVLKFFTAFNILYLFRIFEQFMLAVKNSVGPEIYRCIEYTFSIQDFSSTCVCPEKQSVPWIHCIE